MFKNDETRALGKLTIEVKDKDGKLKQREEVKNLVVDTGLAYIASRMKDASATAMSHMAIGTGSSAAAARRCPRCRRRRRRAQGPCSRRRRRRGRGRT